MKVVKEFLNNFVVLYAINWHIMLAYARTPAHSLCAMTVKMDGKDRTTEDSNTHNSNNKQSPGNLTRLENQLEMVFYWYVPLLVAYKNSQCLWINL